MPSRLHRRLRPAGVLAAAALMLAAAPAPSPGYAAFARQNGKAMDRMMTAMAVAPTGDVDVDFAAMMIPHHQGGIDMARALLRYGHNPALRALARDIVVQQTREIGLMRAALGGHVPVARPGAGGRSMTMR